MQIQGCRDIEFKEFGVSPSWADSKFQSFHISVKRPIRNLLIVSNFKMCEESLRTLYGIIGANIAIYEG